MGEMHRFTAKPAGSNAYANGCRCDECKRLVRVPDRVRKRAARLFREMHPDLWAELYADEWARSRR